ncbi:MAG TPA: diguanylate cyclase [Candidatus Micrarchaeia archaeon]|nr:diguanylate cyclase [Candidatus Micrarchaeia archaeon]
MRSKTSAALFLVSPVILLLGSLAAQAKPTETIALSLPSKPHYVFQRVGDNFGLGSLTPSCILQDQDGFIWIGTPDGLLRFDGTRIVRFGIEQGLPSTNVNQLVLAPSGRIWIATSRGIAYMQGGVLRKLHLASVYNSFRRPSVLALDSWGKVYLATEGGLLRVDPDRPNDFRLWTISDGLPSLEVETVSITSEGRVWFASGNRVGWLDSQDHVHMFPPRSGLSQEPVISILQDFEKILWVRTKAHLYRLNPGSTHFVPELPNLPPANEYGYPVLDRGGNLMIPTVQGLYRRGSGQWEVIDQSRGMATNATFAITEDREGAYWIGLGGAGIQRWIGRKTWSGWTQAEGLPDNVVWSEIRDARKRLWLGTDNGVAMWDPQADRWRVWKAKDGLNGSVARRLVLAPDHSIWVLCYAGGLTRFDPDSLRPEKIPSPGSNPTGIEVGPDGRIWIANSQYLKAARPSQRPFHFVDVPLPPEIHQGFERFAASPDGVLWAMGRNGLSRFDGKHWLRFTTADGLLQDDVVEAAAVSRDEVWFRYFDALGLSRLRLVDGKPQLTHYGLADGLPSLDVYMLGADHEGNVWAGSSFGLTEFFRSGRTLRFTRADGLIWNDLSEEGFFAEEDGTLLFGTSGGLARYNPISADEGAELPPRVVITSAQLGSHERLGERHPEATRIDNTFHVNFAALTYRDPENVRCSYRLAGLESELNETSGREARYPALPPGDYTFTVSCRSARGTLSFPAEFSFTVIPAWWQRWYSRGFAILLALFALYSLVNYRTRKLQNERLRLEEAVAERSEALAQANKELEEMSLTDPLTSARNRRFFQATIASDISQAIRAYTAPDPTRSRRNRDIVFYLIDADHFKEINDRFGHDAGDQMLIELTARISGAIRYSDVLVRWGGEEFLVVSRFCERKEAATLAARVLSAVSGEAFKIKGASLSLRRTVSIGWAAFPWNMHSPIDVNYEEVLSLADRALYKAKNSGRNQAIGALTPESAAEPHTVVAHGDSEARVSEIAATAEYLTTYGLETTSIT